MSRHSDQDKAIARMVGMDVREYNEQPERFVWVQLDRYGNPLLFGGSVSGATVSSFSTEDEAWDEVFPELFGQTMAHFNLSDAQWEALDSKARQDLVQRVWVEDETLWHPHSTVDGHNDYNQA